MSEKTRGVKKRPRRIVKYVRVKQRTPPELIIGPMIRVAQSDSIFDDMLLIGSHKIDLRVSKPELLDYDSDPVEIVKLPPERKRKPTTKKSSVQARTAKQNPSKKKQDDEITVESFQFEEEEEFAPIKAPAGTGGQIRANDSIASLNALFGAAVNMFGLEEPNESTKPEKKRQGKAKRNTGSDEPPEFIPKKVEIDLDTEYEEFPVISDQFEDFEEDDSGKAAKIVGAAKPKGFHIDFVPSVECDVEAELRKYSINDLVERIKAT